MDAQTFEQLVAQALDDLPAPLRRQIKNVAIVVEDYADDGILEMADVEDAMGLYGFYHGIPLTARTHEYGMVLPDVIYLFRQPILALCANSDEVRQEIRRTLWHEIAHYFGIDEEQLKGTSVE